MSFVLEHPIGEGVTLLADLIEERSNGKIKTKFFPAVFLAASVTCMNLSNSVRLI